MLTSDSESHFKAILSLIFKLKFYLYGTQCYIVQYETTKTRRKVGTPVRNLLQYLMKKPHLSLELFFFFNE